jgi:hypothetical protein
MASTSVNRLVACSPLPILGLRRLSTPELDFGQ